LSIFAASAGVASSSDFSYLLQALCPCAKNVEPHRGFRPQQQIFFMQRTMNNERLSKRSQFAGQSEELKGWERILSVNKNGCLTR